VAGAAIDGIFLFHTGASTASLERGVDPLATPASTVLHDNNPNAHSAAGGLDTEVAGAFTIVNNGTITLPLLAAWGGVEAATPAQAAATGEYHLVPAELDAVVASAIQHWAAAGLSAGQLSELQQISFSVADLGGASLGGSGAPGHIAIDDDAAGFGWFVDATPNDNFEFANAASATHLSTDPVEAAAGHMDLLTVVMHEMGHQIGLDDTANTADRDDLMYALLTTGERRLPGAADAAQAGVTADPQPSVQPAAAAAAATQPMVGNNIVGGFDAQYYLAHNPDVAAAGVDPHAHYDTFGWHEGRNPNAYFDAAGYLAHYADVAAAGVDPLQHYEMFGWKEGRDPSASFDTLGYLAANPDVAAAHVNPLDHYLQFGVHEGRAVVNDGIWH
jgi:hypothetical protein